MVLGDGRVENSVSTIVCVVFCSGAMFNRDVDNERASAEIVL